MTRWLLTALVIVALIGCSTTKQVSVVTEPSNWTVGQHDYCIYKANNLICTPQAEMKMNVPYDLRSRYRNGEKVPIEDIMVARSPEITNEVEDRLQRNDRKEIKVSVFDTKFSEKPADFSVWNCITTGLGSPALDCKVMKQPSAKEREYISKKINERAEVKAATAKMAGLSHTILEQRCGPPLERSQDSISTTELYKGESSLLAFHFSTYPEPKDELDLASSLDSQPAKLDHSAVLSGGHLWWGGRVEPESAWFLKQLPCLNK